MKPQYRIRNWSEYNAGLKARGSLTVWIEESMLEEWIVEDLSGKPGASVFYSDLAILTMATLKAVYRLAGRQCQGFVESIFALMEIDLPVPDHSTLSRRLGQLSHVNYPAEFFIHLVRWRNPNGNCRLNATITIGYYKSGLILD